MVDNFCTGECMFKTNRQRLKSLPECYNFNQLPHDFVRRHRNSDVIPPTSIHDSPMRLVNSEPYTNYLPLKTDVGVKSFYEWKPRKHNCSTTIAARANEIIHEDLILSDRKFVLSPSEFQNLCYQSSVLPYNPLKSVLFLRVLYMISSMDVDEHESLPSIQDQFLSDEQIRENLLKELRDGVARLHPDLNNQDSNSGKSGSVTPGEFICNTIPNMIRRQSLVNLRNTDSLSHVSSMASIEGGQISDASEQCDATSLSNTTSHSQHQSNYHNNHNKKKGKMSGREKNLFAPLTF